MIMASQDWKYPFPNKSILSVMMEELSTERGTCWTGPGGIQWPIGYLPCLGISDDTEMRGAAKYAKMMAAIDILRQRSRKNKIQFCCTRDQLKFFEDKGPAYLRSLLEEAMSREEDLDICE